MLSFLDIIFLGDSVKFVELKCKNCGAKLEVEEGTTQVTCKFCNTSFSIDDAYTEGYKYTKGVLKAHDEQMEKEMERAKEFMSYPFGKASKVFTIILFSVIILFFGFAIYNIFFDDSFDVKSFNNSYEVDAGKRSGFFLTGTLDDIVTNNKKNKKHIITVVYKDITTTDEKQIKKIRDSLNTHDYYDVSLDYDEKGYVNKFSIEDIEKKTNSTNTNNSNGYDFDQMKEELEQEMNNFREEFEKK